MPEFPDPMTFDFVKTRIATDLRQVGEMLIDAAAKVEAGDIGLADSILIGADRESGSQLGCWHEMMAIRLAHLSDELERARRQPTKREKRVRPALESAP